MSDNLIWRKSSYSGQPQNECVEVAVDSVGHRLIRDSKDPDGPHLRFTEGELRAFVLGVKDGEFDWAL